MSVSCPMCRTRKLLMLHEKYFCEKCEVYFSTSLEPCVLPIPTVFSSADLCAKCSPLRGKTVACSHFKDYIDKHMFCRDCKRKLHDYFQYNFYKYFSLYRTQRRMLSVSMALLLVALACLSFKLHWIRPAALFFREVFYEIRYASLWKLFAFVAIRHPVFNVALAVTVVSDLRKRTSFYRMPAMFEEFDLQDYVGRLTLGAESRARVGETRHTSPKPAKKEKEDTHVKGLEKKIKGLSL